MSRTINANVSVQTVLFCCLQNLPLWSGFAAFALDKYCAHVRLNCGYVEIFLPLKHVTIALS